MKAERARLEKSIRPTSAWALAVGTIIGWGCFILPGDYLSWSGPLGAFLGMVGGAVIMLFIARAYGYLIEKYPVAGGAFAFSYMGFGRDHAYICGWFLVLTYLSIVPLNATALPIPVNFFLNDALHLGYLYTLAGWDVYLAEVVLACSTILVFGYLNIRGVRSAGGTQFWMVVMMVGSVVLLAIGSLINPDASVQHLKPLFAPGKSMWTAILLVLVLSPWAYMGFDTIPQAAEELGFPAKKANRLMFTAILLGCLMYVVVIFATAVVFPWAEHVYPKVPPWATGDSIRESMGTPGVTILMLGVVMGIFTGINGFFLATSRLLFCMGRARVLPAWFGRVHPVYKTPRNALLFIMVVSLIAPWFGREAIIWIVNMSALGMALGYGYTSLTAVRLSRNTEAQGIRWVFRAAAVFSFSVVALLTLPQSPASLAVPSWIALFAWTLLGAVFYLGRAREYRSIPKEELDHLILDLQETPASN
ncbi:MAG: APC family permease [Lysobacterales bacterium]|jgi:amino acid transporter